MVVPPGRSIIRSDVGAAKMATTTGTAASRPRGIRRGRWSSAWQGRQACVPRDSRFDDHRRANHWIAAVVHHGPGNDRAFRHRDD
jgi:hypothetical protein